MGQGLGVSKSTQESWRERRWDEERYKTQCKEAEGYCLENVPQFFIQEPTSAHFCGCSCIFPVSAHTGLLEVVSTSDAQEPCS